MYLPAPIHLLHCRCQKQRGFSLIELIIVISIIAVLALILVPAVGGVRSRALSAVSASNIRQSGNYLLLHAGENGNQLELKVGGASATDKMWTNIVAGMILGQEPSVVQGLRRRTPSLDVLYCPKFFPYRHDPDNSVWNWATFAAFTVADGEDAAWVQDDTGTTVLRINLGGVDALADRPLLLDSVTLAEARPRQHMSLYRLAGSASIPGVHMRHNGFARALFLDGSVRELDREALHRIGFTSAMDENLNVVTLN